MAFARLLKDWRSQTSGSASAGGVVASSSEQEHPMESATALHHPSMSSVSITGLPLIHQYTTGEELYCENDTVTLTRHDGTRIIVYENTENIAAEKPAGFTRFVCMSDTHNSVNNQFPVPDGDVLIHAGDLTYTGTKAQVINTVEWLASLPHPTKLIIAGNHDLTFDIENYPQYCSSFHRMPEDPIAVKRILTEAGHGILYLEDSAYKLDREHGGWSIYGSPWQPEFGGWAFNKPRGANLREIWERIPENTDILITHGPPRGILDRVVTGESCGCDDLLARVQTIRPLVHIFGHIHEGRGVHVNTDTVFINASTLDRQYQAEHSAIVFDLGRDEHSMSDASIVSNTLTDSN